MRRAFRETRLVVASHNAGNVREIGDLLRPLGVETVSAADLDLPEPEETEASFEGNARLKARWLGPFGIAPFPLPAHRTGLADFPHPALRVGR